MADDLHPYPLTRHTLHLCVDMQRLFSTEGPWPTRRPAFLSGSRHWSGGVPTGCELSRINCLCCGPGTLILLRR